ncbi:tyrosine-type recombinase/integrase [Undibacterium sp. Di26W]|uniref:tyrosine-type recombinase/integrase n=1 Tax=Undibacterium sp. Di26W TaxID=3413035 RepID=UPI003BF41480
MRATKKLNALQIARLTQPGYYPDGGNLILQVTGTGAKSWLFRYNYLGKRREMGLGPLRLVSLADARAKAMQCHLQLLDGEDPIEIRNTESSRRRIALAKAVTFRQCAERCIEDKRPEWKNAKHADQWINTLETYAYPYIGNLDVQTIDTSLVRKCLDPIWTTKTETATRVRQRIETVLDWAKVHGHRNGDNPAAWRGHLDAVLAAPRKIAKAENHAALPYANIRPFMKKLRQRTGMTALALEFTIRTACRTSEVVNARWAEIDLHAGLWTIPAERMKAAIEHTVPLDVQSVGLLKRARTLGQDNDWVFPGAKSGRPLSNMAMLELTRGMAETDATGAPITVHGFRSTFRQWAAECTSHPREVAEHALAHRLPDKVEAAYQRGTMLEKRRRLMVDWSEFIS